MSVKFLERMNPPTLSVEDILPLSASHVNKDEDICHLVDPNIGFVIPKPLVDANIGFVIPKPLGLFALEEEIQKSWEMIKRKFILPSTIPTDEHSCEMFLPIPEYRYPSLTPLLLLYHTDYGDCEIFDPTINEKKPKKVKGLNLKGLEIIDSSLSGWLLLLGRAECRFCCYDLSLKQWHKLLESKCLNSEEHFIGVTDGLSTIMLLESQHNGDLLTLPFEILDKERVIQYPRSQYRLKGKVNNAMLGGNGDILCFTMKQECLFQAARVDRVGGRITLRQSDLNRYFPIPEADFTSLVPSLWGSLLVVCFKGMNCYVYEALHKGKCVKKISSISCYQLNHITLYVAPDGAGTMLFPKHDEAGGYIYLATSRNSDCLLLTFPDDATSEVSFVVRKTCEKQPADKCSCQCSWLMQDSEPSQE